VKALGAGLAQDRYVLVHIGPLGLDGGVGLAETGSSNAIFIAVSSAPGSQDSPAR
jgi:hypothetical protein